MDIRDVNENGLKAIEAARGTPRFLDSALTKITCGECRWFKNFCKEARRFVTKTTPANKCIYFND